MNSIRRHWFGLLTGFVIFVFFVLFILVLLSPRQDALRRGFIPCTEAFAEHFLSCEGNKLACLFSGVIGNSWCDMKVVGRGFSDWLKGRQSTPWSNYIFIPQLPSDAFFDDEARAEYLKTSPDIKAEMRQLHKLNEELENEETRELQVSAEQKPE